MTNYAIPTEEVKKMRPKDFVGTYTYRFNGPYREWILYNERVDRDGDLGGLKVFEDGGVTKKSWWIYNCRCHEGRKHYKSLKDLVRGCPDEELLNLFLKEHCQ